jgi:[ribosomal protein S5]-alanine N-acetyltransferase
LGWWLAADLWGQRLRTEAARLALADGFSRCGLQKVVAIAQEMNRASIRVMEKLGMKFESRVRYHGIAVVLYAIEKKASQK